MPRPIDPCDRCKGAIDIHDMHRIVHNPNGDHDAFDICAKCNESFRAWKQGDAVESVQFFRPWAITGDGALWLKKEAGKCISNP